MTRKTRFTVIITKNRVEKENYRRNIWINHTAEIMISDNLNFEHSLDSEIIDRYEVDSQLEAELVAQTWNNIGVFETRRSLKEVLYSIRGESYQ